MSFPIDFFEILHLVLLHGTKLIFLTFEHSNMLLIMSKSTASKADDRLTENLIIDLFRVYPTKSIRYRDFTCRTLSQILAAI